MIGDDAFFGAYIRSTPEERKVFWEKLKEDCLKKGITLGFYHPYIPLQEVKKDKKDNE
jgi:hypothetical protein